LPRHGAHGIKGARGSPRLPREAAAEISRPRTRIGEGTPWPATILITNGQFSGLVALPGTSAVVDRRVDALTVAIAIAHLTTGRMRICCAAGVVL